jgi:hypothetical protein
MDWVTAAMIVPLAFILYLFVMDWIDLYPWNDVTTIPRQRKLWLSLINAIPLLYISLAFKLRHPGLMVIALIIVFFYMIVHIISWWIPYFFGSSEARRLEHERLFSETVTILPRIKDHPTPNVGHMVLGLYITVMLIISVNALMRT